MTTLPQSPIQERLKLLNHLNVDLRRLLDESHALAQCRRPHYREEVIFSHRDYGGDAHEFYAAIQKVYTCSCATAHVANLGCHCDVCIRPLMAYPESVSSTRGWEFGLAFPRRHDSLSCPRLLSAMVVLEPLSWSNERDERYVGLERFWVCS